jgi:ABC-type nitrate/sulfonate/bicarbonate transport system substrate-binding protein
LTAVIIASSSLYSCGKDEEATPEDQNKSLTSSVQIVTLGGAGEVAMASLPEGFDVSLSLKPTDIETLILNNDYDLAVVSTNTAARLYQRSGGEMVVVSPIVLNDWMIVSNNGYITNQELTGLRGKRIVACGQGGTGEAVFRKLLADRYINPDYGVRMEWVSTPAEVIAALKQTGTIGLLQEPYVSQAMEQPTDGGEMKIDIDLGALWEASYGSPIPTDVIIANKQFVSERADDVRIFISRI